MKSIAHLFRETRQAALFVAGCVAAFSGHAQSTVTVNGFPAPVLYGAEPLNIGNLANKSTNMGQFTISTAANGNFTVYCLDPLRSATQQAYYSISLDSFFQTTNYAGSGVGSTSYQKEYTDTTYTNANLSSATVWGLASQTNANTVLANLKTLYSHAYSDSLTNSEHSQAFQYAVWEVLLDKPVIAVTNPGGYSTATSNLSIGSPTNASYTNFSTIAAGYLSALNNGTWATAYNIGAGAVNLAAVTNYVYNVFVPTGAGGQIVMNVQVPEPGVLSLAALALLCLAISRRRSAQA